MHIKQLTGAVLLPGMPTRAMSLRSAEYTQHLISLLCCFFALRSHPSAHPQLMGFWVANTLSPVQFAKFMVYSWPYYPLCSALAEGAAILPIADEVDEEVQEFTKRRREGMQAELEWLVKHTHQLIDLN